RLTINVPGSARPGLELLSFGAPRQPLGMLGLSVPGQFPVFDSGPIGVRAQVRNNGNFQVQGSGSVDLVDPFGNVLGRVELPADQVFPGDVGTFDGRWADPPIFALVTARAGLNSAGAAVTA